MSQDKDRPEIEVFPTPRPEIFIDQSGACMAPPEKPDLGSVMLEHASTIMYLLDGKLTIILLYFSYTESRLAATDFAMTSGSYKAIPTSQCYISIWPISHRLFRGLTG